MNEKVLYTAFNYGVPTVLVFLLLYGGYKLALAIREDHRKDYEGVTRRLNEVEDFQKEKLNDALDKSTIAITQNTETLKEVKEVIQKCKGPNS